jgi:beta-lactamase regulating signal transducer with metallopeptidase domain
VVVLLKLFTPPIVTAGLPIAFNFNSSATVEGAVTHRTASGSSHAADRTGPIATTHAQGAVAEGRPKPRPLVGTTKSAGAEGWSPSAILAAIWACGACVMAAIYAVGVRRFARGLRDSVAAPTAILAMVDRLSGRLGLGRVPEVLMTPRALPPLVWSLGTRPRLILPSRLFDRLSVEAQATILAHELAHIRRGDHLVRLLELAATTVFWWHPVAWLAGRRLRELEELCCDGRVLELLPDRPRTYAAALVDTLEFLSGGTRTPAPLRTAIHSTTSLSRRILMLTQRRTGRLTALSAAIVVGLAGLPLAVAFAVEQDPAVKAAPVNQPLADAPGAVLRGRVTTKAGTPLRGARVLVAIPAIDMRQIEPGAAIKLLETRADANGEYLLQLPGIDKRTKISVDAKMPGFRTVWGTLMAGGDFKEVEVDPGATVEAVLPLEPARYFAGVVVDEQGKPIASAEVVSTFAFDRGMAYVEMTASGPDGSFELFNYPLDPAKFFGDEVRKGTVNFAHPDYIASRIEDVYAVEPAKRGELRVVLATGRKLAGTVLDSAGKPVPRAMVEVDPADYTHRRATLSDANGHFALRGLDGGPTKLNVLAKEIKQRARLELALGADKDGLEVRLQSIVLPANMKTYDVLGMKLADVTPELKSAYDLYHDRGAVILDPGPDSDRLNIGRLAEGYNFWLVGEQKIGSVREFVDQILKEAGGQVAEEYSIRIVYVFKTPEQTGGRTTYIKLTKDDIARLKTVSDQLKADPK